MSRVLPSVPAAMEAEDDKEGKAVAEEEGGEDTVGVKDNGAVGVTGGEGEAEEEKEADMRLFLAAVIHGVS